MMPRIFLKMLPDHRGREGHQQNKQCTTDLFTHIERYEGEVMQIMNGSIALLCPQPAFRDFIAAGEQVVFVAAGDELFVWQLHPPTTGLLAL